MNAPPKPDPVLEGRQASQLLDVLIRAGLVFAGDALLPDLLAIPDLDGLGGDPRRRDVPAPSAARVPARRQAGTGCHANRSAWCGGDRSADGPASISAVPQIAP